jgi:putative spermidine/putrescine transport system ATP-binding protein
MLSGAFSQNVELATCEWQKVPGEFQMAPPLEVYHRPVDRFVADFIGTNNFVDATVEGAREVEALGRRLPVATLAAVATGARVTLSIRPEKVELHRAAPAAGDAFEGEVTFVRDLGLMVETFVDVQGVPVVVVGAPRAEVGERVWVRFPAEHVVVLRA